MTNLFSFGQFLLESSKPSLELREKLISIADEYFDCSDIFYVDDQGRVCNKGSVSLHDNSIEEIPVQFGTIGGSFELKFAKKLKTLEGCPETVGANFVLWDCNSLETLDGCPQTVGHAFVLKCSNLKTLMGAPREVKGLVDISDEGKIPHDEIEIYTNDDLRKTWIESGRSASDFMKHKRGFVAKKKFGF